MNNIAICIPTYKRPLMLKNLVLSIYRCNLNKSLIGEISIIIVDNDKDKTAEKAVIEFKENSHDSIKIAYHNYPIKGLSNVRNELLKESLTVSPDFIVFIDDDEYASVEWLNKLAETIITNNCDMVMGPVISVFESNVSEHISYWFKRPNHQNNTRIDYIATNNLIIRTETFLRHKIWFDSRFNKTGAEDSYFGEQMIKQGAKAYWSEEAIVYETIPESRANIFWLTKRFYNAANTYTYILKLEKKYFSLLKKTLTSFLYIISGICTIIFVLIPLRRRYWGLLKLAEGLGGIAGLISLKYYEYK